MWLVFKGDGDDVTPVREAGSGLALRVHVQFVCQAIELECL